MSLQCPSYMAKGMQKNTARALIRDAVKKLKGLQFEAVAFRGISGAVIAPVIAYRLNKTLIVVRKSTANSHAYNLVQGVVTTAKYIIVDDFISTGETFRTIRDDIKKHLSAMAICVAFISYDPNYFCRTIAIFDGVPIIVLDA